jgi:enoyl-CoA hydratase
MKLYATILAESAGPHLLKVTLNRPEVGNARNTQMGRDLLDLWTTLIDDPRDVRCVILTGAGDRNGSTSTKSSSAAVTRYWNVRSR